MPQGRTRVRTAPLNEMFTVTYGNKLDLNKLAQVPRGPTSVNFVGRSSQNHGVSGYVMPIEGTKPYPAGTITVSLGGSKLLSAFVQMEPFYTAQNVAVLQPMSDVTLAEKLYVCLAIRHNRFRYTAFGREANRTLRTLPVPHPSEFPVWIRKVDLSTLEGDLTQPAVAPGAELDVTQWKEFRIGDLFDIHKGKRLTKAAMTPGTTPFIGAIDQNNGVRQYVDGVASHPANVLTVNYNGSVAEAFYQPAPFLASDDVNVLYPVFDGMDPLVGMFVCTVLRREKYRFSYGRKWNLERMRESVIRLPAKEDGQVDADAMRRFVAALPFSAAVADRNDEQDVAESDSLQAA